MKTIKMIISISICFITGCGVRTIKYYPKTDYLNRISSQQKDSMVQLYVSSHNACVISQKECDQEDKIKRELELSNTCVERGNDNDYRFFQKHYSLKIFQSMDIYEKVFIKTRPCKPVMAIESCAPGWTLHPGDPRWNNPVTVGDNPNWGNIDGPTCKKRYSPNLFSLISCLFSRKLCDFYVPEEFGDKGRRGTWRADD